MSWIEELRYDPIKPLLESENVFIRYFTTRDILDEQVADISSIWNMKEPQNILKKQQANGSWRSYSKNSEKYPLVNYELIETWKQYRYLIEMYQFDKSIEAVEKASEYIFSCQSVEGDIRGILANQYAMYYTGAILYLLIRAGYQNDHRVDAGMKWLLSRRQDDGGWVGTPSQTLHLSGRMIKELTTTDRILQEHDTSMPSSYHFTGMVIRAFVLHPEYRELDSVRRAAAILKSGFFQPDRYTSYHHREHWIRFQFPFWWNNLVSALDSLSYLHFTSDDEDISLALQWLQEYQTAEGLWKNSYSSIHGSKPSREVQLWISLCICRILKRFDEK